MDAVMVVQADSDIALGAVLSDDVFVERGDDVARRLVVIGKRLRAASARLFRALGWSAAPSCLHHLLLQRDARIESRPVALADVVRLRVDLDDLAAVLLDMIRFVADDAIDVHRRYYT